MFLTNALSTDFTCFRIVLDEFSFVICLLLCLSPAELSFRSCIISRLGAAASVDCEQLHYHICSGRSMAEFHLQFRPYRLHFVAVTHAYVQPMVGSLFCALFGWHVKQFL